MSKTGAEINFPKYFYEFKPLSRLEDIKQEILALETETSGLMNQIFKK